MTLDQATAALIGAFIGAATALVSSLLTGWRLARIEHEKWLRAREDSFRTEKRSALADVARALASYSHSIMWFTYKALDAEGVSEEELANFEIEIHKGVADMVSCQ